jgi:hypothetical protein
MNNFRAIDAQDSNDDTDSFMTETPTTRYDAAFGPNKVIAHWRPALPESKPEGGREVLDP